MSEPFKICPICGTPAHRNAALCSTCGATLSNVKVIEDETRPWRPTSYEHRYGETDLFESEVNRRGQTYLLGMILSLTLIACGVLAFVLGPGIVSAVRGQFGSPSASPTAVPTSGPPPIVVPLDTNTPRPTLNLATVTPAPPTEPPTATEGPCMRTVKSGDDLISLAISCGHRDLAIVDLIVTMNALAGPDSLQVGQKIEIPWPTPTLDPAGLPTQDAAAMVITGTPDPNRTVAPVEQALAISNVIATETLQPGVSYHRVVSGENIAVIAYKYGANVEILSQLNPEITFSQCDFSSPVGGPNCIVPVYIGQLVRVPAPTPTPTIQPSPNGSETATASPTATNNAPVLRDPDNRSLFTRERIITLRWVSTGTLGKNQVYRVRLEDTTAGLAFTADTTDISLIIPDAWQAQDSRRHEYSWSVSVIDKDRPDDPYFTTESRIFSWEGRGVTS